MYFYGSFYFIFKGGACMENMARETYNEYMRNWRAKNKDRVKEYNKRYWENKSKKVRNENEI